MGFIKSWFTPEMPPVPAAPPAPTLKDTDTERRMRGGGRASTILAGDDPESETVGGSRQLLGAGMAMKG